jgi:hypothetical protein
VKCVDWDNYPIECYPEERYEKTTQLEGVSMDVFVTEKGAKELEKHGSLRSITSRRNRHTCH